MVVNKVNMKNKNLKQINFQKWIKNCSLYKYLKCEINVETKIILFYIFLV